MLVFSLSKKSKELKNVKQPKPLTELPTAETVIKLVELENGKSARVYKFQGSPVLTGKLRSMGIVPGTIIVKKSAILAKGPVVVKKGSVQFAVGYDMAQNILVEPVKHKV